MIESILAERPEHKRDSFPYRSKRSQKQMVFDYVKDTTEPFTIHDVVEGVGRYTQNVPTPRQLGKLFRQYKDQGILEDIPSMSTHNVKVWRFVGGSA